MGVAVAQIALEHLAVPVGWQRFTPRKAYWLSKVGKFSTTVVVQDYWRQRFSTAANEGRGDPLSPFGMRDASRRGFGNAVKSEQRLPNLALVYVRSAADNHVFLSVDRVQAAVLDFSTDVARYCFKPKIWQFANNFQQTYATPLTCPHWLVRFECKCIDGFLAKLGDRLLFGVSPLGRTVSGGRFDRLAGLFLLETVGAQVAEGRV